MCLWAQDAETRHALCNVCIATDPLHPQRPRCEWVLLAHAEYMPLCQTQVPACWHECDAICMCSYIESSLGVGEVLMLMEALRNTMPTHMCRAYNTLSRPLHVNTKRWYMFACAVFQLPRCSMTRPAIHRRHWCQCLSAASARSRDVHGSSGAAPSIHVGGHTVGGSFGDQVACVMFAHGG